MAKLIIEFNRDRTVTRAKRLIAYLNKHPMAICFASSCDVSIIEIARKVAKEG